MQIKLLKENILGRVRQKTLARMGLVAVIFVAYFIYRVGLHGPFIFDDGINVVHNDNLHIKDLSWASIFRAATSIPNGVFGRPLSMLSFAANYYWDKDVVSPFPISNTFKATNLLIHLANGCVVFVLTFLLVRAGTKFRQSPYPSSYAHWLALAVAAAWLLHPFNLTTVLYVVQRMTSLATFFMLCGMVCYLVGRRRLVNSQSGACTLMVTAVMLFTPLAFLCKEIGILLPGYLVLVEYLLFRRNDLPNESRRFVHIYFVLFAWLPLGVGVIFFIGHADWFLNAYSRRDFTLTERLMTESRVVWFYLYQTVLPNIALMGMFHDDIEISRSMLDPASTAMASIGLIGVVSIIFATRKYQPLIAFGLVFFLFGHSLESTIIPLELVHEHRNYLPSVGPLLLVFHLLLDPTTAMGAKTLRRLSAVILLLLFTTITMSRAKEWSSAEALWNAETTHHPTSARAHLAQADYYAGVLAFDPLTKESNYVAAKDAYEHVLKLDKNNTDALFGILKLGKTFERSVDKRNVEALQESLKIGTLSANTNDRLTDLALCIGQANCPVTAGQFEGLLGAALENTKLQGRDKALIYSAQTIYLAEVAHDYPAALASIRYAIALDGDIEHQMWLAHILIAMHDVQAAQRQIALLRQLDGHHMRKNDIAELALKLDINSR